MLHVLAWKNHYWGLHILVNSFIVGQFQYPYLANIIDFSKGLIFDHDPISLFIVSKLDMHGMQQNNLIVSTFIFSYNTCLVLL